MREKNCNLIEEGKDDPELATLSASGTSVKIRRKSSSFSSKVDTREIWGNKLDFLFSCISVSVGLGNVWRFPYLCYKNGGGAFLICYIISALFCGIPMFFQEVAIGQYLGSGGMTFVGKLCPIFAGTGYASMTIVFLLDVYYCIIVSWTLLYLFSCFISLPSLPWQDCGHWWNSENCVTDAISVNTHNETSIYNISRNVTNLNLTKVAFTVTPAEEFWRHRVLMITEGIENLGGMQWELLASLFIGWLIIYIILGRGLHQNGKVVWFTALFPYVIIMILLFRAVTLPGSVDGLRFLISTDFEKLKSAQTWIDGVSQIFFGYSLGVGTLPALGSYNRFEHNCYRDAVVTCIVNTITCVLASMITFSILGFMAFTQGTSVNSVVQSGPGLVFITYPEVVLKLPAAPLWAALFFFMLAIIGIDSEFCNVESFITGLVDKWSSVLRPRRKLFAFVICFSMFLLGIPMVTQGGVYIFQLFDFYAASGLSLLWVCFFQTIAISWFFGTERFNSCVYQMMGVKLHWFFTICLQFVAPFIMMGVFLFFAFNFEPVKYGESYTYPKWGEYLGICMSTMSMMWIPLYMIYYLIKEPGTLAEKLKRGVTPQFEILAIKKNTTETISADMIQPANPVSESKVGLLCASQVKLAN
ncbi:sodium- and chloride-dependent GABA transporter 1-like isoform X2 [Planococcus citri]